MNYNPCITIDVSQGKSHIQGFFDLSKPIGKKAKAMRHSKHGFLEIKSLVDIIYQNCKIVPLIIFEYTGIYHKTLEKFLQANHLKYHIVSPLRAAKSRQNELRSVKTDKRDCISLAKMYYNNVLGEFYNEDEDYKILRSLNRYYENILMRLQEIKVNFREMLAIIYPNYHITKINQSGAFKNVYTKESIAFLKKYPHPEYLLEDSYENFIKYLSTVIAKNKKLEVNNIGKEIYEYVEAIVSGCNKTSPEVHNLTFLLNQIILYQHELDDTVEKMVHYSSKYSLYYLLMSIPCIKENLASRFVAELGDISRFKNYKSIIAYVGIDPIIYQSGINQGLHLNISKKGNKHLRTILYLMVKQLTRTSNIQSNIKDFYQKKVNEGRNKLSATIACCNKLIRIIFYINKTGCSYQYPN